MIYDLQKASLLKRLTAFILDFILVCVLAAGIGMSASALLNYDSYYDAAAACKQRYEAEYGFSLTPSQEEYNKMTDEQKALLEEAATKCARDPEMVYNYDMIVNLSLLIITVSILLAFLALEFAVPILIGNGQTLGKKIFGSGLMKNAGVKVNNVTLFIRAILGKFAIETMIPVLIVIMTLLGVMGIVGPVVLLGLLILQIYLMVSSKTNAMIHDTLAHTVTVVMSSQLIFGSEHELIDYKNRAHEDMVRRRKY